MRKSIALAIAAIGIGLTTNVLASSAVSDGGAKVNPSTINLSADGVTEVGIHTVLPKGTPVSCVHVVDATAPIANTYDFYDDIGELTLGSDSVGHLVISLNNWEYKIVEPPISTGVATFEIYGVSDKPKKSDCGDAALLLGSDDAKIVDNSGEKQ